MGTPNAFATKLGAGTAATKTQDEISQDLQENRETAQPAPMQFGLKGDEDESTQEVLKEVAEEAEAELEPGPPNEELDLTPETPAEAVENEQPPQVESTAIRNEPIVTETVLEPTSEVTLTSGEPRNAQDMNPGDVPSSTEAMATTQEPNPPQLGGHLNSELDNPAPPAVGPDASIIDPPIPAEPITYSIHPMSKFTMGPYQFVGGRLRLDSEKEEKQFLKLLAQQPPLDRNRIRKIDRLAAEEIVRQHRGHMTQGVDTSESGIQADPRTNSNS